MVRAEGGVHVLPLSGIRVLDFTRVLAGPYATMMLGDLGADVIKVESVGAGDETRAWGPPFVQNESAYYLCVNRNKRDIALNLKDEAAKPIVKELIRSSDVVIHNFLPHSAKHLGLAYEEVQAIRPDVVYCAISGYGEESIRPGYDYLLQAEGGLMSITGEVDGQPMKVGVAVTDLFTGQSAAISILAALLHRHRTGEGQAIDMALYDAQIAMLANVASNVLVSSSDARRFGNEHPNIVPYQSFAAKDGHVVVTVGNDRQWQSFCEALQFHDLAVHPDYQTNQNRVLHRETLIPELEARIQTLGRDELMARLGEVGVPCGPVRSVKEALDAKQTAIREMVWTIPEGKLAGVSLVGSPLKLRSTPPALHSPPPEQGEHSLEVLRQLNLTEAQIQTLISQGVIRCSTSH